MGRRTNSADFKAKVALEAIRERRTVAELSSEYGLHPTMVVRWKREAVEYLPKAFSVRTDGNDRGKDDLIETLYKQVGQLTMELEWIKKKSVLVKKSEAGSN